VPDAALLPLPHLIVSRSLAGAFKSIRRFACGMRTVLHLSSHAIKTAQV
jgi:hypothetical protein